jgi:hypothetical protein
VCPAFTAAIPLPVTWSTCASVSDLGTELIRWVRTDGKSQIGGPSLLEITYQPFKLKLNQYFLVFTGTFFFFLFFEINTYIYIKLASRLIKNLPVPLGILVRKRVRQKLAAYLNVWLHRSAVYR